MPRIQTVPREEAPPKIVSLYDQVFGKDETRSPSRAPRPARPGIGGPSGPRPGILSAFGPPGGRATLDPELPRTGHPAHRLHAGGPVRLLPHCKAARRVGGMREVLSTPCRTIADCSRRASGPCSPTRPRAHLGGRPGARPRVRGAARAPQRAAHPDAHLLASTCTRCMRRPVRPCGWNIRRHRLALFPRHTVQ